MNFMILLMSTLVIITEINGSPINLRNRKGGPDADSSDPVGSALLRPVFLGKSTGIKRQSFDLTGRNSHNRGSHVEFVEPEGEPEREYDSEPDRESEASEHFGIPFDVRRQQVVQHERIFHPDSDRIQGRFGHNVVAVDDPLPEMIAGGDIAANPFAEKPSLSSIIGRLFMESIGLKK